MARHPIIPIRIPKHISTKLSALRRVLKELGFPAELFLEGSYAIGKANARSDIDLCLVVPKKSYHDFRMRFGRTVRTLRGVVRVFDFGESMGHPGYHYCYIIFNQLGPYKVFDICIVAKGQKVFRGKQALLFSIPASKRIG